jgi:competence ComEA-like helix-hairpin-helix protein
MQSKFRIVRSALALVALVALVGPPAHGAEPHHPININSASVEELASLPGIGDSKAKAIVEYRAAEPFKTVEDLKKVKGIGDKMLDAVRHFANTGHLGSTM